MKNISIILDRPTHPGNIGACARAMKNMRIEQLILVAPKLFPHKEATDRASGAADILEKATVVSTIDEAVQDQAWLFATSARDREFPWPQLSPEAAAEKIVSLLSTNAKIGILFGTESAGLPNEVLQRCDYHITIPTNPEYSSLNLAQAVQVITYEIYHTFLKDKPVTAEELIYEKATQDEVQGFLNQFEQISVAMGFMDPAHPKKLMPRLRRLFAKAQLEKEEINILRGFLKLVNQRI